MENLDKELTLPKIRGDSPAENTQKPSNNFSPKSLPKPKSSRFLKKALWVSVVHGSHQKQAALHVPLPDCAQSNARERTRTRTHARSSMHPKNAVRTKYDAEIE